MRGVERFHHMSAESQLPGNKDAAHAASFHARGSQVPSSKRTELTQHHRHRLGIAQFGFAVVAHHRLAVLVLYRRTGMIHAGVEFGGDDFWAIRRQPP